MRLKKKPTMHSRIQHPVNRADNRADNKLDAWTIMIQLPALGVPPRVPLGVPLGVPVLDMTSTITVETGERTKNLTKRYECEMGGKRVARVLCWVVGLITSPSCYDSCSDYFGSTVHDD